ncbi:MAG: HlyD family type I secretion periplasmic adaptor subunit [Alphaproteobacteria bacterium]|nr:HlyD family type I secretion periplasmic adaptor subunit [Alphaproteobacteria bacterium]MBV9552522.1 HlyD family type I secretion periplasmic adaptor subunit [Alphaproteobacteria bacterium]
MKLSNIVVPFPRQLARRQELELAFLPAALEIVETPPSPIGRAIPLVIVSVFCLAVAWASFCNIDIVASAEGKIVPTGRSKTVQSFDTSVVRAIEVHDGQFVHEGDPLIELDPTIDQAEQQHLQSDLTAAQLDVERLHAALSNAADPLALFHPPADAPAGLVANERQLLVDAVEAQRAKLGSLDHQIAEKSAERDTTGRTIDKIAAEIPLQQQRVDARKYLFDNGLGSKLQYLQEAQDLVTNQKELLVQKSRLNEAEATLSALVEQRAQAVSEYRRGLADDLVKADAKAAGLTQDVIKAARKTGLQHLTAPVDGRVQQLAVHTVGGVVTPAQPLLVIVPDADKLEIEAMVSNRDIGFVHPGQTADVKVDTFSYTRYGLLHGTVESLSADAVTPDRRQDDPNARATGLDKNAVPTDTGAKEPVYSARVSLDKTAMTIDDRKVALAPGMAVTVEIKTGSRRIISYLLSPLLRYGHESLRER